MTRPASDRVVPWRTLLIDNYDSYTLNLLRLFGATVPGRCQSDVAPEDTELPVAQVVVIRNDQYSWSVPFRDILYTLSLCLTDE